MIQKVGKNKSNYFVKQNYLSPILKFKEPKKEFRLFSQRKKNALQLVNARHCCFLSTINQLTINKILLTHDFLLINKGKEKSFITHRL